MNTNPSAITGKATEAINNSWMVGLIVLLVIAAVIVVGILLGTCIITANCVVGHC
jgi:hypothetical protein